MAAVDPGPYPPGQITEIVKHTVPRPGGSVAPHERDLDQPKGPIFPKTWERPRRARLILFIAILLGLAVLGAVIAYVDDVAKRGDLVRLQDSLEHNALSSGRSL